MVLVEVEEDEILELIYLMTNRYLPVAPSFSTAVNAKKGLHASFVL